ncbi:hypothetical protein PYCCODRAFT_1438124 [Trametes coccinea BRFM310]|uniref:DUF6534 domain-containing protein n=1 Tax=Trametes coccinea (strain BRFM310) TaxID=1353009 RepID=A0A1Y2II26_TRAC3|nr:hypothetical protein PYCCODRAFT_1438124 [Trametes coccinea BRFM310]
MSSFFPNDDTMAATLASTVSSLPAPSLGSTSGAVLLGTIFGSMLYGLVLYQTYKYYRLYPKDRIALKSLVCIIAVMETIHNALWILVCYEYFVVNFFNPLNLLRTHWYVQLTVPFSGFTPLVAQIFYACRLYYLGTEIKYRLIVAATVVIMLSDFGWDIAGTILVFHAKTLADFSHSSWIVSVSSGHLVVGDTLIAATLIYVLRQNRTGFRRTDSVLDLLVMYTINSGLLIMISALFTFAFALRDPNNLIYAGISIVGVKLYSNSALAMLNSRRHLSSRMMGAFEAGSEDLVPRTHDDAPLSTLQWNVRQITVSLPVTSEVTSDTATSAGGGNVASGDRLLGGSDSDLKPSDVARPAVDVTRTV